MSPHRRLWQRGCSEWKRHRWGGPINDFVLITATSHFCSICVLIHPSFLATSLEVFPWRALSSRGFDGAVRTGVSLKSAFNASENHSRQRFAGSATPDLIHWCLHASVNNVTVLFIRLPGCCYWLNVTVLLCAWKRYHSHFDPGLVFTSYSIIQTTR